MTHSQENELKGLESRYKIVGLDRRDLDRRNYLLSTKRKEVEALSVKLGRWAERSSTKL